MTKRDLLCDVECYWNYFLVAFEDVKTGDQFEYSMYGEKSVLDKDQRKSLRRFLTKNRSITFNGRNYDMLILTAATLGYSCEELKILTNDIIEGKNKPWDIEREYKFKVPDLDHIDLIEVAFGRASLKIYNGRLHGKKLQDLPYPHDARLSRIEADNVCDYCFNDLDATRNLNGALSGQLNLRRVLSREHGIDLRSKSDAQVAEAIIKKEMVRLTGKCEKPNSRDWVIGTEFYYKAPRFIKFRSEKLRVLLDQIQTVPFKIGKGGYVNLPDEIKAEKIRINDGVYTLGIGGLHSTEKSISHVSDDDYILRDSDVTSYYPEIILALKLFPKQLGPTFLKIYGRIVRDRVAAKHKVGELTASLTGINDPNIIGRIKGEIEKYSIAADGGKIMVNGSFGKFGSQYSVLYSPPLLIQTTVTGQLSLLMLIEAMEDIGIEIVSANTDGIVAKIPRWMENEYYEIIRKWEEQTNFKMEFTDYSGVYSRDVNSYIAVKPDGKVKTKGAYSMGAMSNNPQTEICIDAVIAHITGTASIISTIKGCKDMRKFITLRTVNGGAIWPAKMIDGIPRHIPSIPNGEYLGKAIRWYYAKGVDWTIHYKKPTQSGTHNKVPMTFGARPCMDLPDTIPDDIDFAWYMRKAYDILSDIGLEVDPYLVNKKKRKVAEETECYGDKYGIENRSPF